jgi:hypothetical protein
VSAPSLVSVRLPLHPYKSLSVCSSVFILACASMRLTAVSVLPPVFHDCAEARLSVCLLKLKLETNKIKQSVKKC